MHRFFLPPEACHERPLRLSGGEAHHALRVLRLRCGEEVQVLDGQGHQYHCRIGEVGKDWAVINIVRTDFLKPPPAQITLFQALPKHKTWDALLPKATELGVSRIVAVLTERTVPHPGGSPRDHYRSRWQQAVVEACKQCGQPWLPQVQGPLAWPEALQLWANSELHLAGILQPGGGRVREQFARFVSSQGRLPKSVGLWIGPEGDFTPAEAAALLAHGAKPITLGPLVLRVDTAATAALALISDEFHHAEAIDPPRNQA